MKRVCIFCGKNDGNLPLFRDEAKRLAQGLVERGIGLVYGGASIGLMGQLADTVMQGGGEAIGVIPEALVSKEYAHQGLSKLHVVKTMHERKKLMFDLSDAFLTLPGGFGTLDETFEILTWKQIGIHQKPLIFLNINDYYRPLIEFIDKAVVAGFVSPQHRDLFRTAEDSEAVLKMLARR